MAGSLFRKLGILRRDDSSSDSDEEVRNEFTAPSDSPPPISSNDIFPERPQSVFSRQSHSSITGGSKSTRRTKYSAGTADTSNSLRSESSKRQQLKLVVIESGNQTSENFNTPQTLEHVVKELNALTAKMKVLDEQADRENAPRISATLARLINDYTAIFNRTNLETDDLPDEILSIILRIVLGFTDVFLVAQEHTASRMHLLKALHNFALSLDLMDSDNADPNNYSSFSTMMDGGAITVPQPKIFAVGAGKRIMPNENVLMAVIDNLESRSVPIVEQEGAYVAPILRGLSLRFSVATLCLGIPDLQSDHFDSIIALRSQLKQLHVYCRHDSIVSAGVGNPGTIKVPYRLPSDPSSPPISMSIASSTANYVSGTLGGYVFPQTSDSRIDDRNVYALTCGHVCLRPGKSGSLQGIDSESFQPEIICPSPVLRKLFKKALMYQSDRFDPDSSQYCAFQEAIAEVDEQPRTVLGEVVWGERTVVSGSMSDIAVIKCKPGIECMNWLGNDIDFSQYDPTLIMDQLRVRCLVGKSRGLQVFKYGSTSRYTNGIISSLRIAYWASGVLQTSEFSIRSNDSTAFANGGDSGAWILSSNPEGLGVVGMLHSYNGEYKEFGLYTPMPFILERLRKVTGTPWGVLGVPSELDEIDEKAERSS